MSALNVSDPHISMAYDALSHHDPLRWFLLTYSNKPNQLSLHASGTGDLDELRACITPENVYYGVFRETDHDSAFYVSLAVIPDSVGGVRRARALVHARAVSSIFKAPQSLSATNPDQITVEALRSALHLPPRGAATATPTIASTNIESGSSHGDTGCSPPPELEPAVTSPSTGSPTPITSNSEGTPLSQSRSHRKPPPRLSMPPTSKNPAAIIKALAVFSPHSRAGPSPVSSHPSESLPSTHDQRSLPTPTSPNLQIGDAASSSGLRTPASLLARSEAPLPPPPVEPDANLNAIPTSKVEPVPASPLWSIPDESSVHSKESELSPDAIPSLGQSPVSGTPPAPHAISTNDASTALTPAQEEVVRARGGWAAATRTDDAVPPPLPSKPSPTAEDTLKGETLRSLGRGAPPSKVENDTGSRRRATEDAHSQITHSTMGTYPSMQGTRRVASQEVAHYPPISHSRFLERATPEALAEEQRLARLEEERRRRTVERVERQRQEREEEEARERAFVERKERERTRRVELARQAEARRAEVRKREEEACAEREEKEAKEREAKAAEARAKAQKHIERRGSGMELLSGFVTLEMGSVWRRRYFRLSTDSWQFFRNDKDVTQPVHVIELARVRALREWNEGYEELEAIPHSFAVELTDGGPLPFFADSTEDKQILLGLLNQAAGL